MTVQLMKPLLGGVKTIGTFAATALGGWLAYSAFGIDHNVPLRPALDAERATLTTEKAGKVSYYLDQTQTGRPLVLLHSINAAPSAMEIKPLFEHYRKLRPVYALDLPGFGFSERSDRQYVPSLYADAITDFLRNEVDEAADLIALSLSAEFAAMVALAHPKLVHSLTLVSPTGLGPPRTLSTETSQNIHQFVNFPLWSQGLFDLLTIRASSHYYAQKSFVQEVPTEFIDCAYANSHQPGAKHAPFYFLSGQLFTWDVRETVYEKLEIPTLVLYDRDPNVGFDMLPHLLEHNINWRAERIAPTLGLPHWDMLPETTAVLDQYWAEIKHE